jgi:TRAP-type C4-dicarboxylate transport system permease small subunit
MKMEGVLTFSAIVSTIMMACLTTADTGLRYFFNRPIVGSYEIMEKYLMVCCVFFALCYAYREGANIRVTFFVRRLSRRVNLMIAYFVQLFSLFYILSLTITTLKHSIVGIKDSLMLTTYDIPLGPAYMMVPVGLFFLTLAMIFDLWQVRRGETGLFRGEEEDFPTTQSK